MFTNLPLILYFTLLQKSMKPEGISPGKNHTNCNLERDEDTILVLLQAKYISCGSYVAVAKRTSSSKKELGNKG